MNWNILGKVIKSIYDFQLIFHIKIKHQIKIILKSYYGNMNSSYIHEVYHFCSNEDMSFYKYYDSALQKTKQKSEEQYMQMLLGMCDVPCQWNGSVWSTKAEVKFIYLTSHEHGSFNWNGMWYYHAGLVNSPCLSYPFVIMLRLHYVPGSHGSPVCPKRSAPWDFWHFFLSFHVLLSFLTVYHGIRDGSWGYGLLSPGGSKARYG